MQTRYQSRWFGLLSSTSPSEAFSPRYFSEMRQEHRVWIGSDKLADEWQQCRGVGQAEISVVVDHIFVAPSVKTMGMPLKSFLLALDDC